MSLPHPSRYDSGNRKYSHTQWEMTSTGYRCPLYDGTVSKGHPSHDDQPEDHLTGPGQRDSATFRAIHVAGGPLSKLETGGHRRCHVPHCDDQDGTRLMRQVLPFSHPLVRAALRMLAHAFMTTGPPTPRGAGRSDVAVPLLVVDRGGLLGVGPLRAQDLGVELLGGIRAFHDVTEVLQPCRVEVLRSDVEGGVID